MPRRWTRRSLLALAALACVKVGCATPRLRAELPRQRIVERGQLVVYTNLEIDRDEPLLVELDQLRLDLESLLSIHVPSEMVRVYLFESPGAYDAYMKSAFPSLPQRRAFFVQTESRLIVYAHKNDLLEDDLRHETTHGYLHAAIPAVPIWLDEGLAEFFEPPRESAGLNMPHVALLLADLDAGRWTPDLIRLERATQLHDMSQLDYAESWLWMHWMLQTSPERRRLLADYLAALRGSVDAAPLSARLPSPATARDELVAHLQTLAPRR